LIEVFCKNTEIHPNDYRDSRLSIFQCLIWVKVHIFLILNLTDMRKNPLMILSLILGMGINGFTQDCPCVKTAVIGNDSNATFIHNNIVTSMPDTTIILGSSVNLQTITSIGKMKWYALGSETEITNLAVKPAATAEFIVKSELTGCPDAYDTVKISVKSSAIGLNELGYLSVFPNPTNGKLTINPGNETISNIEIVDINGEIMMKQAVTNGNPVQEINITHLKSGMYFINLTLANDSAISKQIIKN
jgi:hypothetical protein